MSDDDKKKHWKGRRWRSNLLAVPVCPPVLFVWKSFLLQILLYSHEWWFRLLLHQKLTEVVGMSSNNLLNFVIRQQFLCFSVCCLFYDATINSLYIYIYIVMTIFLCPLESWPTMRPIITSSSSTTALGGPWLPPPGAHPSSYSVDSEVHFSSAKGQCC